MYSDEFGKLWLKLTKELKSQMEERLAPTITEGQLNVLELLLGHDRMKPSDLIEYLSTTPAAVTTLLDRMEKAELIVRERDEKDRRIVWIHVTDKGKAECDRGRGIREHVLNTYLSRVSAHNQKLFIYLLGKVTNEASPSGAAVMATATGS
ncbi:MULTISPECIES: MarR family winged helix-turn-helix transcriptional regulator [Paenibacillus]|uniref:MarR family transcriptional regulator n=1 Tax=Paenibacillus whitsoniae TaxID=2496558 RepID=A0A3S0CXJ1_9BACL|nr:MarR family transcriptional regulator [Paenibacillus whitsoniae]RTE11064.1 MarR family transcriptional regulator [Paenibacillus whitsoniae]